MTKRVAILISGSGSNMVSLVQSMTGDHPGRPVLVLSNVATASGLQKAATFGVPTSCVSHQDHADRASFDAALTDTLKTAAPDLICLAGFMRILTPDFVAEWDGRLLNIHPSLLPRHKGLNTHARALEAGDRTHGCTVHGVTARLDDGPILGQAHLTVHPDDTAEMLAARVLKLEHQLYPAVLRHVLTGGTEPITIAG